MNMNELLRKKGRKEERSLINPRGPHDAQGIPLSKLSIPIPWTDEWRSLIRDYRRLAAQEDTSVSHVLRSALTEYHQRHFPGNPNLSLNHWTKDEPFSPAAREKLSLPKCLEGERNLCPSEPTLCVNRSKFSCKFKEGYLK